MVLKLKELRVRMDSELLYRFQLICVKKRLKAPRQVASLIRKFVEIQEQNEVNIERMSK